MVLESLISPLKAELNPWKVMLLGAVYASIGLGLSVLIFRDYASLIMVFLTSMAAIPLIYNLIRLEEKKDLSDLGEGFLLIEHSRALMAFISYFVGATVAFALWYVVLSYAAPSLSVSSLFKVQIDTITTIRGGVTGNVIAGFDIFTQILSNNLRVLIFSIFFSFLYGVGAVFILTWNASVIGVAIGDTIRSGLLSLGETFHIGMTPGYAAVTTCGLLRYSLHGIPEILSYFVAGLAGGIISVAAIRHDFGTKKYVSIIMDSSVLLLISLGLLLLAAILEVYASPGLYYRICTI